jgi:hypothetical protein
LIIFRNNVFRFTYVRFYYKEVVHIINYFVNYIDVNFFNQNSPSPSKSSNIALLNEQDLSDALTKDIGSKSNTTVSAQMDNSANASPPMELTDTNNTTDTTVNVNLKSEPLNLMRTAKVKDGTTLLSITREYYNNVNITLLYIIIKANPNIKDIHHLRTNQEIIIPKITLETPLIKTSEDKYNIELGTFETISKAKKHYEDPILSSEKIKIISRKVSLKDTWYQVILEKYATRKDCLATVELLKEKDLLACFNNIKLN